MDKERFILQKSNQSKGRWVLTDTKNLIVIRFREHEFNTSQKVTLLEDFDINKIAGITQYLREMGDWMVENHKELLFKNYEEIEM